MGKEADHHGHDQAEKQLKQVLELSAKTPSPARSNALTPMPRPMLMRAGEQLMKSDTDMVYEERSGRLFLNDNGK